MIDHQRQDVGHSILMTDDLVTEAWDPTYNAVQGRKSDDSNDQPHEGGVGILKLTRSIAMDTPEA